jgi:hypothetical protein
MMARSMTRSNQRPDTLMQDRTAARSTKPLATHGRTILMGQIRPWRSIDVDGGLSPDSFRAGPIRNAPPWLALPFGVPDDQLHRTLQRAN